METRKVTSQERPELWVQVDLALTITFAGALHSGSGYDRGLIQRTVVRDASGDVYIPGSSLKGKVRNACEDLARRCKLPVCGLPRAGMSLDEHDPKSCLVCRVFGAIGANVPSGRSLYWTDAHLTEEWRKQFASLQSPWAAPVWGQTTTRTQVRLNRACGIASEGLLYTSEFSLPQLQFTGRVSGWLSTTSCTLAAGYYEVSLLLAGLRLVEMLGGGRSRGAGKCRISLPDVIVVRPEGQAQSETYPVSDLLAAAEFLPLFLLDEPARRGNGT